MNLFKGSTEFYKIQCCGCATVKDLMEVPSEDDSYRKTYAREREGAAKACSIAAAQGWKQIGERTNMCPKCLEKARG